MDKALQDDRFSHILKDPRFRKIPRNVQKVKVDKRFKDMFAERNFKEKCRSDKRGRPLNLDPGENLKKLYNITTDSSDDANEEDDDGPNLNKSKTKASLKKKTSQKSNTDKSFLKKIFREKGPADELDIEQNVNLKDRKSKKVEKKIQKIQPVLPEESDEEDSEESGKDSSEERDSSSEDSDSESDDSESVKSEGFDHHWEELNAEAPDTEEATRRIAVCNMDWDRIRAEDLYAVFNSFKPPDSCIQSVKIYPSEFGLKRMEEEKLTGPPELVEEVLDPIEVEDEDEEVADAKGSKGSKYHREKLRQYQINRLRYYYAVVECDTSETANTLYDQLNGMEYESSSVRFDLRFVSDDVTFDQEPTSVSDKMADPTEYKPRLFVTTALQQVKVNLTWDETDPKRRETLQKAFTEPNSIDRDIRDYLASSSGDSEEEPEGNEEVDMKLSTKARIAKYKELLKSLEEKEKESEEKFEMEITWEPGLKEKTQEVVKEKLRNDSTNPFEELLKKKKEDRKSKRKEKKQPNKDEAELSSESENSDADSGTKTQKETDVSNTKNLDELYLMSDTKKLQKPDEKQSKKKKKLEKIDQFKCDVKDPRFSAVYSSHLYNVDPSDPHFKHTEGNLAIVQEKQDRLQNKFSSTDSKKNSKKMKYS